MSHTKSVQPKFYKTMKTIKLILASALVIGAVAVNAQDSTSVTPTPTPQPQPQLDQPAPPQTDPTQQPQTDYKKDMVVVPAAEIPASLRSTLQGSQYQGWEEGTIYRNQTSDLYIVEMRHGDETMVHRF